MRQTFYEFCMLHERTNLLKEWDKSRNFPLTPDTVSYGSKKKVWWTCENGPLSPRDVSTGSKIRIWWRCPEGHSWQSPVASRTARGARMSRVRGQDDRHGRK